MFHLVGDQLSLVQTPALTKRKDSVIICMVGFQRHILKGELFFGLQNEIFNLILSNSMEQRRGGESVGIFIMV